MRLTWLIVVGIASFGCKDPPSAKPAEAPAPATPGSGTPALRAQPRPEPPTLEAARSFDAETRDAAWASTAEKSIQAVAPQLTGVTCHKMQCRVTLTAASEAELVEATDKLQGEDSLRSIDGVKSVLLTRAEQREGRFAINLYVRFDRDVGESD